MGLLMKNEREANVIVAKVMRVTFLIFTLIYILNLVGIFVVDQTIMTVSYVAGAIFLLSPTVLVKCIKEKTQYIKYINVVFASGFVILLSITLTYHVVVLYVYGIAIASLYFSKKLNIIATVISVIGLSIGQVVAFFLQTLQDDNFTVMSDLLIYGVIPRALVLIAIAAIFTMLCGRTASMLGNLLGAEEQMEMLDKIRALREQNKEVSEHLLEMVQELVALTTISSDSNQRISAEAEEMMHSTDENAEQIQRMNEDITKISAQTEELGIMSREIAKAAEEIDELSKSNQQIMEMATNRMEGIAQSATESKETVQRLGEESKEILGIIQVITGISTQTNILALNASIEAARAGEHGKGFAVVADEIQKLSEQTKQAVESIGAIVRQVVNNTERTVLSIEESVTLTQEGVAKIKEAENSTLKITKSNEAMTLRIQQMDYISERVASSEKNVVAAMEGISNNTMQNVNAVEHVTTATKDNNQAAKQLVEMVEQIRALAERLNEEEMGV